MAVVHYKVTVAGGKATITPDPAQVELRTGDYMVFNIDPGGPTVQVQVKPGTRVICAATGRLKLLSPPVVNGDGAVVVAFQNDGGDPGPGDPFP